MAFRFYDLAAIFFLRAVGYTSAAGHTSAAAYLRAAETAAGEMSWPLQRVAAIALLSAA